MPGMISFANLPTFYSSKRTNYVKEYINLTVFPLYKRSYQKGLLFLLSAISCFSSPFSLPLLGCLLLSVGVTSSPVCLGKKLVVSRTLAG
ncbi:hypothetical protein ES288_A12G006800v1 [Gossypium darwinii]|uniref:Uncharacterized protein n=2 Tax=Gossypium TaxID=3633 RepID=A0A5D2MQS9_GOSTO|nr:hypothetical protein ES288_A12G006800v1 [Gossypium darwinii]TYH93927.1 hypothetical protein ES332_A12G006900v1 [Gossypium tomentosum]